MKKHKKPFSRRRAYTSQFFRGNRLAFGVALAEKLLTAALNLGIAWVLQQMVDAVSGVPGALSLGTLALLTLGILALIVLFKAIRYVSYPRFMKRAIAQYKRCAFGKLTQKSIASFRREDTAAYLSAFSNDAAAIETGYLENLFELSAEAILCVGSLVMMLCYSPVMTAVACVFFILPIGVSLLAGSRMEKAERKISDRNGAFLAALKDSLSGFSVVKGFQAEDSMLALFDARNQDAEQAKCEKRKISTVISALDGVAGVTAQLGTFLVGAWLARSGWGMTPGILLVFLNLTANVIVPVQQMPGQLATWRAAMALIDKLAEALETNVREEGAAMAKELESGIQIENLSFGYEAGKNILQGIDAFFGAGKSYAIVGASGSGKSTLLNLLMASHPGYSGHIRYDGQELRDIDSESLYHAVSMIEQNVFIFNASIRDNITMFRDFPKEAVDRAISRSGLQALIEAKGEGYLCGENGSGLSGGEKQRISIARSLLRDSSVLLVDEATAALDAQTAYQVTGSILDLEGVTRIVVTHTLEESLLKQYDGILALKNGSIAETGSFETLMAQKGYFYSLYTVVQ